MLAGLLACGLVFTGTVTIQAVRNGLQGGMDRLGADILVVPSGYETKGSQILLGGESSSFYMLESNLAKVAAVPGVERTSPQLYITSAIMVCCTMPTIQLVGFDPATDFIVSPWLDFHEKKTEDGVDTMIVGANTMYAADGTFISFFGKRFQIHGATLKTGIKFIDYSAFMTIPVARRMISISQTKSKAPLVIGQDEISSVAVKVAPGAKVSDVARAIEESVPGIKTIISRNLVSTFKHDMRGMMLGIIATGTMSWAMTLVLMGIVFTTIVNERRRELGLLRAMGASRDDILRLILLEAAILSGLGALAGLGGGVMLIDRIEQILVLSAGVGGVPFHLPSLAFIVLVALMSGLAILLSGTATAIYPAMRVARIEPYDAIRKG